MPRTFFGSIPCRDLRAIRQNQHVSATVPRGHNRLRSLLSGTASSSPRHFLTSLLLLLSVVFCSEVRSQDADSTESLRLQFEEMRRDYETRIARIEADQSNFSTQQRTEDGNFDAAVEAFRRQLELRVPGYTALPSSAERSLLAEIQDRQILKNLFTFHGYARSGFGGSGRGSDQEVFQAPDVPTKYRLGNENDTYVELALERSRELESGVMVRGELMLAMQTLQNATFDPTDNFLLRQSYIEMWKLPMVPEWRFWVGNRYYDRHDIHIIDYFFLDMSGYGGGIQDIPCHCAKLAVAYLGGALEFPVTDRGRIANHNVDVRLYDIPSPAGNMLLWALGSYESGGTVPAETEENKDGYAFGLIHITEELLGGFAKSSVQYGKGSSANFSSSVNMPFTDFNLDSQLQFTNTVTIHPCEWFTMQAIGIYRRTTAPDFDTPETEWVSGGLRPIFHLTQHGAVALEYGVDFVDSGPLQVEGSVHKLTVSPMLRADTNFFSRPELRSFVTFAWWGDEFRGLVGGPTYAEEANGVSFGVQGEHWW